MLYDIVEMLKRSKILFNYFREGESWRIDEGIELTDVSVGGSQMWGIGTGQQIYQRGAGASEWTKINGGLSQVRL